MRNVNLEQNCNKKEYPLDSHDDIMKLLTDRCIYYGHSRSKRKYDIKKNNGKKPTINFEQWGCFSCDGYNRKCLEYSSSLGEYIKGIRKE